MGLAREQLIKINGLGAVEDLEATRAANRAEQEARRVHISAALGSEATAYGVLHATRSRALHSGEVPAVVIESSDNEPEK